MARSSRRRRVQIRAGCRPAALGDIVRPAVRVPWQRCEALLDSAADRSTGRHVEQVWWCWRGPLDLPRFRAAWQSVVERESILRTSFAPHPAPHLVCHPRARAEVTRHAAGGVDWHGLLERDRLRGFDVTRPGPLRITLVDTRVPDTVRVLFTFHRGLLDAWSVALLQHEFTRAYLAGGALPGGERRPDVRDWMCWLERQDSAAARDFFSRDLPLDSAALLPGPAGASTGQHGHGRAGTRLAAAEASRLHRWAVLRGLPDSSVLHAAWALLLGRTARATGPVRVGFGVTVSGRGIALDDAERLVGPLRGALPMTALVDPDRPVAGLLSDLRDRALDLAAYEWVCPGQIQEWTGRSDPPPESLVSMERAPDALPDLRHQLAAAGIGHGPRHGAGAHSLQPVTLSVRDGADGSRELTVLHDRARLADRDARLLAERCAWLLRRLPDLDGGETVAEMLAALPGTG